ncbi:Beta-galactosidase [Cucumis melo var. makuwa]|uniref:Beta-galactosidase n=1 Tax=Cucumis melo var. makuwa TaxID=1194695 RepID=A0A5A7TT27_CUCMM|nr:Beta-galactosidase [Cucumis melo var. makuwa]
MVSEQSNNETLENNLGETQIETEPVTAAAAMEKLLENLEKLPFYPTGVVSQSYAPPSDQKMIHVSLVSGAWADASPPFHVTAPPISFYALSDVQPSNPSGHPYPHEPLMSSRQQPSTLNLSNLYNKHPLYVDSLQQPLFSDNRIDQPWNRSDIEMDESLTHSKPTELSMYSKNLVHNNKQGTLDVTIYFNKLSLLWQEIDLCRETVWDTPNNSMQYAKLEEADRVYDFLQGLNPKFDNVCGRILGQRSLPFLMEVCFEVRLEEDRNNVMGVLTTHTIDFAAFSARSSNHDRRAYISETTPASTSQSTDPTASQTKTPTLGAITQSGTSQSLGLISVDGKNPWILDSGATDHLTADGSLAPIAGKGQIVPFDVFALQNILHVPKLSYNLLSISKITRELHCKAIFLPSVYFQDMSSKRTIGTAQHSRGLYILDDDTSCISLSRAKQHWVSFSSQPYKPTQPFTLIHSDVWGPSKVTTSSGKRWFVTFIEDSSMTIPILPGSTLSQINLSEFLASKGIVHQTSCAYTPQQNGVAERKNCHLVEVARSLMLSTSLPSFLWGDVILTATYLVNRMPSRILHLQNLLDCLKESYPSTCLVSEVPLHVFGCTVYVHNFGPNQTKFIPRAQACVFVGYPLL